MNKKAMEFTMEWNVICRVCLQEGDMHSIFEEDDGDILICDKIRQCSSVKIERGINLPENICTKCLNDLRIAYIFRNNCESSDAVLQSFVKGNIVNDLIITTNGELYKYKPPEGLKVQRITKIDAPIVIKEEIPEDEIDNEDVQSGDIETIESISEMDDYLEDDNHLQETFSTTTTNENGSIYTTVKEVRDDINSQPDDEDTYATSHDYKIIRYDVSTYEDSFQGDEINDDLEEENNEINTLNIETIIGHKEVSEKKAVKRRKYPVHRQPRQKKIATSEKPMHICEICGNSYKHRHSLDTHMRRHRNEKPFACEICGRAFVLNVELRCHMRTHTGQKPYPCRYCGRRFSDFGSRIKHERTHTGERPYACETCGKAFAYSYGLSSHMLTHTGEKPFECEKCGKRFSKKHHLKNHLNTHLKQENRLRVKVPFPPTNLIVNTSNTGGGSSEDEYSSMLTVLTNEAKIEQSTENYLDDNIIEIKEESNTVRFEISEIPS